MNKIQLQVDVVSDVVCPWCYIGKRRLEKALASLPPEYEVQVRFLPFELNPDTPKSGVDHRAYLSNKFGGEERYEQLHQHVTQVAAGEGLNFRFDQQRVMPNTFEAHRLIQYSAASGKQGAIKEALMKAYFEQGVDLSKRDNLVEIAVACGLEAEATRAYLASNEGVDETKAMEQMNYKRGISGVPFYIINQKYGVSGAQPSEAFVQILTGVAKEVETAAACDTDTKVC